MVPYKFVFVFLFIRSTQKIQEAQSSQKGCVHMYGYKLFIFHLFFMRIFQCFAYENPFQKHATHYYVTINVLT
jgi:hypothetical protein